MASSTPLGVPGLIGRRPAPRGGRPVFHRNVVPGADDLRPPGGARVPAAHRDNVRGHEALRPAAVAGGGPERDGLLRAGHDHKIRFKILLRDLIPLNMPSSATERLKT